MNKITPLIELLLKEEFAVENKFEEKSLDDILHFLYEDISTDKISASQLNSKYSCKNLAYLILLDWEMEGLEFIPTETLYEIAFPQNTIRSSTWNEMAAVHPDAQTWLSAANYFFSNRKEIAIPEAVVLKITAQQLCLAIESEGHGKIGSLLKNWWPSREHNISLLLNTESPHFEIHPDLKNALDRIADIHSNLLIDSSFPHDQTENTLKFILNFSEFEKLSPTSFDLGIFIFFFGQQHFLERFLNNSLGIEGLEADEVIELAFRLIRLQKLKALAFNAVPTFTHENFSTLEEDATEILGLYRKIKMTLNQLPKAA